MIEYLIIVILIVFSALFSGLTLGLMSLNAPELKRKMSLGDKNAAKVYEVRKRGNLLLTTLLIGNVAVNTTLSIFLGSIAPGVVAGLIATFLIVVFGEIAPQAIFSRYALLLGAKVAWLVKIFIFVLYPIAWPIAWVLNKALGEELTTIYSKKELMKIIEEHEDNKKSDVDAEEEKIVKGALTFSDKLVKQVATPRIVLIAFESSRKIDKTLIDEVRKSGQSRFPVYQGRLDNIVGILYLAQLLGNKNDGMLVKDIANKKVFFVDENNTLDDVLRAFLQTHHHLFIVQNSFGGVMGVITLEDILEEITQSEIMDESDIHQDLRMVAKEKYKGRKKPFENM